MFCYLQSHTLFFFLWLSFLPDASEKSVRTASYLACWNKRKESNNSGACWFLAFNTADQDVLFVILFRLRYAPTALDYFYSYHRGVPVTSAVGIRGARIYSMGDLESGVPQGGILSLNIICFYKHNHFLYPLFVTSMCRWPPNLYWESS